MPMGLQLALSGSVDALLAHRGEIGTDVVAGLQAQPEVAAIADARLQVVQPYRMRQRIPALEIQ